MLVTGHADRFSELIPAAQFCEVHEDCIGCCWPIFNTACSDGLGVFQMHTRLLSKLHQARAQQSTRWYQKCASLIGSLVPAEVL